MVDPTATVSPNARIYAKRLVVGKHSRIDDGVIITGDVDIGDYVHIGAYTFLSGTHGIRIGDYSGLAAFCSILSASDDFSGRSMHNPTIPGLYKPGLAGAHIDIGKNVLIGSHCAIGPGVKIEDNVGIGAHSFVKKGCEGGWIYTGVPAKKLKPRSKDIEALTELFEREIV